jgi:hypothetical protein
LPGNGTVVRSRRGIKNNFHKKVSPGLYVRDLLFIHSYAYTTIENVLSKRFDKLNIHIGK